MTTIQTIRNEIKKAGYTSRQVNVRKKDCGYSESIHITIKDANININIIKSIALQYENFERDDHTYEILEGGNTYIFVEYEYGILEEAAKPLIPICEKVQNNPKYYGETIAKNEKSIVTYIPDSELGNSIVLIEGYQRTRVWIHEINDFAVAMFKYRNFGYICWF